ncbi:MAG: hypothetical protein ACHRHE_02215 [Tepidisphaerales bacterium]
MSNHTHHKRRVRPIYPTRPELLAEPGRLLEHLPSTWQSLISKGGLTVAFLVSGLTAIPGAAAETPAPAAAKAAAQPADRPVQLAAGAAIVAPIFEHGKGRASTGCVVIAPPVFLTEEEARQIIIEELAKAGLKMSAKDVELKDVRIKPKSPFGFVTKDGKTEIVKYGDEPRPLVIDLMDPDKHVAIEFVSESDYLELGGEMWKSTVHDYDFKKVSEAVAGQIKTSGKGNIFGVFYEPTSLIEHRRGPTADELAGKNEKEQQEVWQKIWKEAQEEAKKSSREELRKQVKDFAEWLRQRGVI